MIDVDSGDELSFFAKPAFRTCFQSSNPLEHVGQSSIRESLRRMSSEVSSSSIEDKSDNGSDERELSSDRTPSINEAENSGKEGRSEESSLEETRPAKKARISHRSKAESYPIDEMKCNTMKNDLDRLREAYNIPSDVDVRILGPKDTPSRPSPQRVCNFMLRMLQIGSETTSATLFHLSAGQNEPRS